MTVARGGLVGVRRRLGAGPHVGRSAVYDKLVRAFAVIAAVYLAKPLLLPITFSVIIGLTLSPVIDWLGRVGLNRYVAIVLTLLVSVGILGTAGGLVTLQTTKITKKLPEYRDAIIAKTERLGQAGKLMRQSFQKLGETIGGSPEPQKDSAPPAEGKGDGNSKGSSTQGGGGMGAIAELAKNLMGVMGNVATAFVVLILFLLYKQDLSERLQRVLKQRAIPTSRATFEEAGARVAKYLFNATIVNFSYGAVVALGTWLLKVPHPAFWGLLVFLFRFIPYIGTWLVASLALTLSLAVSTSWVNPAILLAFWVALELITANVLEPLLYRKRTGLTAFGIMMSALFWNWLWGVPGLVIAVPVTTYLVELGGEISGLKWLHLLVRTTPSPEARLQD